jgi:excisionase family DNA binding protein
VARGYNRGKMPLLTVQEASARFGLSGRQIRKLLAAGTVKGSKRGPFWLLDEASLARYVATERKPGPAPRKR